MEESGFVKVKSAVVPGFAFKSESTRNSAESFGVKAVHFTAWKPAAEK
jgi:hypothetical protein